MHINKLNHVERRQYGFESFDADLEAVAKGLLARLAALRWYRERDVVNQVPFFISVPQLPTLSRYHIHT